MADLELRQFINDLMNNARNFGRTWGNNAFATSERAIQALSSVQIEPPSLDYLENISFAPARSPSTIIRDVVQPTITLENVPVPDLITPDGVTSSTSSFIGVGGGYTDTPPEIDAQIGNYRRPEYPDAFNFTPPDIDTDVVIPDIPAFNDPGAPQLIELSIPERPVVNLDVGEVPPLPTLEVSVPNDLAQQFLDTFNRMKAEVNGDVEDKLQATLARYFPKAVEQGELMDQYLCDFIEGKRTAMTDKLEAELYARLQARNEAQARRELEELEATARQTGNPVMPGMLRLMRGRVIENTAQRNTEATIAVHEQRFNVEIEHLRFVLDMLYKLRTAALELRGAEYQALLQSSEVALRASQSYVEQLVVQVDKAIEIFRAEVDLWRARVTELQERRAFALAQIELYKAEIDAEKVKASINTDLIRQYEVQIQAQEAVYNALNSQIQAIIATVNLRKVPLEIFSEQVRAYQGYVQGIEGQTRVFEALINGDVAKIRAQQAQLEGWVAGQEVRRIELDHERFRLEKSEAYNRLALSVFEANNVQNTNLLALNKLNAEIAEIAQRGDITKYQTEAELLAETFRSGNQIQLQNAELNAKYLAEADRISVEFTKLLLAQVESFASISANLASTYGTIGAASLSGVNAIANVGEQLSKEG